MLSFEFWDEIAHNYDSNMKSNGQRELLVEELKKALKDTKVNSVLDIGSGTGSILKELFTPHAKITAIEPSLFMYFKLQENLRGYKVNPKLDFAENITSYEQADLLMFSLSINWLHKPDLVLKNSLTANPDYILVAKQIVQNQQNLGAGSPLQPQIQSSYKEVEELEFLTNIGFKLEHESVRKLTRFDGGTSKDDLQTRLYLRK